MALRIEDEVAILPSVNSRPSDVVEIAKIAHAGPVFVQLEDGRMFATLGGMGLNNHCCIVAVRQEHRIALQRRNHRELAHELGS
jgi:hypothetical protein